MTKRPRSSLETFLYIKAKPGFPEWPKIKPALMRLAENHGHPVKTICIVWWRGDDTPAEQIALMIEVARYITSLGFEYIHGSMAFSYYQQAKDERSDPLRPQFWIRALNWLMVTSEIVALEVVSDGRQFRSLFDGEPSDDSNPPSWLKGTKANRWRLSTLDYAALRAALSQVIRYLSWSDSPDFVYPYDAVAENSYTGLIGDLGLVGISNTHEFQSVPADGLPLRGADNKQRPIRCWTQHLTPAPVAPPNQVTWAQWLAIDFDAIRKLCAELAYCCLYVNASQAADVIDQIAAHHREQSRDRKGAVNISHVEGNP